MDPSSTVLNDCSSTPAEQQQPPKIVFFDVETTIPFRSGQKHELLEFGALVLDPQGLSELDSYNTLIRPKHVDNITGRSVACNGITKENISDAPTFAEVADAIFRLLDGRIWAGHNIENFDIIRVNEAFLEINRQPPRNVGVIDTYPLLKKTFGKRAGNYKLASLANYCGYGKQEHRSLADVRMNLAVLRSCATILFLEMHYPSMFASEPEVISCSSTLKQYASQSLSSGKRRNSAHIVVNQESDASSPIKSFPMLERLSGEQTANRQVSFKDTVVNTETLTVSEGAVQSSPSVVRPSQEQMLNEVSERAGISTSPVDSKCAKLCTHPPPCEIMEHRDSSSSCILENPPSLEDVPTDSKSFKPVVFESLEEWRQVLGHPELAFENEAGNDGTQVKDVPVLGCTQVKDAPILETTLPQNTSGCADAINEELSELSEALCMLSLRGRPAVVHTNEHLSRTGVGTVPFLSATDISISLIGLQDEISHIGCKKVLCYNGFPLQLFEQKIRMRFTVNPMYAFDHMGKPRFSVLIEPSASACEVLRACEDVVKSHIISTLSQSEVLWLPALRNETGVWGARMSIGATGLGPSASYTTKFYRSASGGVEEIDLGHVDITSFRSVFPHGSVIDVGLGFYIFNFDNRAGVRLLAKYITLT